MRFVERLPVHWRCVAGVLIALVWLQFVPVVASQSKGKEELAAIQAAAEHFLQVFADLDWEPFRASWASEPTVFFPFDDTPERATGRAAVEARFRRFFDEVRKRTSGPPYLNLKPLELRVERFGDAGLVTFTLGQPPGRVSRRTLLFVRENNSWKLAHLHASAAGQP
jgi:ketosteroid isomerase-like protein